jgi:thiamine biosynthesis lipoprotein
VSRSRYAVVSRLRVALGTLVALEAQSADERTSEAGIAAAFTAIARVERLMHPERLGSDVAVLCGAVPGTPVTVDEWTWEVLSLCQSLHQLSAGAFDPCLSLAPGRMTDIELLGDRQVRAHAPVRVDLGGVAKGYAVDRAIAAMQASRCDAGLVNAGGDLAVFGARSHTVFCRSASGSASASLVAVELSDAALASSDTESLSRPQEHQGYYHGSDRQVPITGRVGVMATSAAVADALTKCLLACDANSGQTLLRAFGARRVL